MVFQAFPKWLGNAWAISQVQNNIIQAQQANAQIEAQRENAQAIIDNQNRIEQQRIEEEKDPNSILNKFKNANLKKENEDLKAKLLQMELLLSQKEEKERLEKEKIKKKSYRKKFKVKNKAYLNNRNLVLK